MRPAPHDLTESGAFSCAGALGFLNLYCQIEYVSSDNDVGTAAASLPWRGALTAELLFVLIAACGVADNHFVSNAVTTT